MDQATRVLLVDDDTGLRQVMAEYFETHGISVTQADSAREMREHLAQGEGFDAIVLDLMMPGEDGLTALSSLSIATRPPVILLSVLGTDIDRIVGIEAGADDYLAKPCNPRELLARVRALIRRSRLNATPAETPPPPSTSSDDGVWVFDGWSINRDKWQVLAPSGASVDLSTSEFRLLFELVRRGGRLSSRDSLIEAISGDEADMFDRAIDVTISRLRKKLADHNGGGLIRTVRGEGYMLTVTPEALR